MLNFYHPGTYGQSFFLMLIPAPVQDTSNLFG